MSVNSVKKSKLFDIKLLPMDLARLVCACLIPIFRIKRITPDGKKYTKKIKGGAIIAANHTSFSDPFIVGVTFWYRRVYFLIAEIVMGGKFRSALLRGVGGIKVERSITDIEAVKKSVKVLKNGRILIVFPQGGIVKENDVESIKSGSVLMALQAGVPIIPMHICPKKNWYSRQTVIIGDTIYPNQICKKKIPTFNDINEITATLMSEMQRCNIDKEN